MTAMDEAYLDAAARALDLDLSPESRAGVLQNLAVLSRMAAVFDGVALDPHDDPLPLFRP